MVIFYSDTWFAHNTISCSQSNFEERKESYSFNCNLKKAACDREGVYAEVSARISRGSGVMTVKSEMTRIHWLILEKLDEKKKDSSFAASDSALPITINYQIKFFRHAFDVAQNQRSAVLRDMFQKELFPDCIAISSEGREFKVHKSVLAVNSAVFLSMFGNEFEEKNGEVFLNETTAVLRELLRFFYYRDVEGLDPIAEPLLAAADKYLVNDLMQVCAVPILRKLNVDNAIRLVILGFKHNCKQIEEYAVSFIAR